jgi:hypothetical protein
MYFTGRYPFIFLLVFLCLSVGCFSQKKKDNFYLQALAGNSFYSKSSTATNPLSPGVELSFVTGAESDSLKWSFFYSAGIGYYRNQQTFDVVWAGNGNPTPPVSDLFSTNEFLFNAGGAANYKISPKLSVNFLFGFQCSHNHTWIDDINDSVKIDKLEIHHPDFHPSLAYITSPFATSGVNTLKTRTDYYSWEYLQFYFVTGVQFRYLISERVSFLFGIKPRFSFYYNDITEERPWAVKMNYSPVKLMPHFAFQFKLFK